MFGLQYNSHSKSLPLPAFVAAVGVLASVVNAQNSAAQPAATAEQPANLDASAASAQDPDQVLRHAVFFKFKNGASAEDVKRVVEAFAALPGKIREIAAYEWGDNIGPPSVSGGLTHCFLLTFNDEAGRSVYLPHADHKTFGNVLRPHLEKVFVIDYWGSEPQLKLERPLRHLVFFKFKESASDADVRAIEDAFAALPAKIDAIKGFEWGRNNSPETHDEGFSHCFMVTFDSEAGLAEYAKHPDHEAFARMIGPVVEKVRVIDYRANTGSGTNSD